MSSIYDFPRRWKEHPQNPLIRPRFPAFLLADPTFLPPEDTPDSMWHLFAHSGVAGASLFSILHYVSGDGTLWRQVSGSIAGRIRPFLFREGNNYYLFTERILRYLPLYASSIELQSSTDLVNWGEPHPVMSASLRWHAEGPSAGSVGNPCLVRDRGGYRLFYSAGLVFLPDCGFSEPKYVGYALGQDIDGPFVPAEQPIMGPTPDDPDMNVAAGSIKVAKLDDGYVALHNGIYRRPATLLSGSSIRIWKSRDGSDWTLLDRKPILEPDQGWKRSHVYACDVRRREHEWTVFFNARSGWLLGRECIGRADAGLS